jgi:glutamate-1-semialdehyde aminotransferase
VFGTPHRREIDMARLLNRLVPCAEQVRFTNSGLEATLLCLRLAAAYTGRSRIGKLEGHYHGSHDQVLVSYSPRDYRDLAHADAARRRVLDLRLLARGVYSRPQDHFNLSLAHTEAELAQTGKAFEQALAGL